MAFTTLASIATRETVPGFHGKFIHTDNMTVSHWEIDAGSSMPAHEHPHEQITLVQEGVFELTVDGETRQMKVGDIAIIPGNVPHFGRAITDCRLVDVFCPARDDYR